jgi:hypothetical protein
MVVPRTLVLIGLWTGLVKENPFPSEISQESRNLALVGAKIYPSPAEKPIVNGAVLIKSGKLVAVSERRLIKVPSGVTVLDCTGLTLTAVFGIVTCIS